MSDGGVDGRVLVVVDDGVGRVVLDNQVRLNAFDEAMLVSLKDSMRTLDGDPSIRVIVITGAGDRAFSAGADLGALVGAPSLPASFDAAYRAALHAMHEVSTPIIGAIGGVCLGGGLALALEADIRICRVGSEFGIPAARIGLGYRDVASLVRAVGPAWAAEMLFSGRRLSSEEARSCGLVNHAVEPDAFEAKTNDFAGAIAANAPLAVRTAKAALSQMRKHPADQNWVLVDELVDACLRSSDFAEGRQAFAERRAPRFTGS